MNVDMLLRRHGNVALDESLETRLLHPKLIIACHDLREEEAAGRIGGEFLCLVRQFVPH